MQTNNMSVPIENMGYLSARGIGIGMGLLSMFNFIAAAGSTAVIGKVLDGGTSTVQLNPFVHDKVAFVYSNILLALAVVVVVMTVLYYYQFGRKFNNK
ncbi:hypothetical protein [Paenibacillus amylolyticus]|uniref:hypothetical protein n=1 Tax=Paenibacillus amylolyticus TaxID=1451 RepID=UPI0039B02CEC